MKKMRMKVLLLLMLVMTLIMTGCGAGGADKSEKATGDEGEKDYSITITEEIQEIIDRGYMNVGVKTDVPGFGYYDKDTKTYSGMEIDLAYQLAAKIFDTTPAEAKKQDLVHFTKATVDNRSTLLVEHSVDCVIATFTITDERKEIFAFSDSYYTDAIGLMVKKDYSDANSLGTSAITSLKKVDGKKVGVAKNADTRAHMLNYISQQGLNVNPMFFEYATYEQLYRALKNGTIDVFAVDSSILNGYVDDTLTILPDRFAQQNYGVAAPKSSTGLIDAVNVVIEQYGY